MQILQVYLAPAHFANSPSKVKLKAPQITISKYVSKREETHVLGPDESWCMENLLQQFTESLHLIYHLFGLGKVSLTKKSQVIYKYIPHKIGSFIK